MNEEINRDHLWETLNNAFHMIAKKESNLLLVLIA